MEIPCGFGDENNEVGNKTFKKVYRRLFRVIGCILLFVIFYRIKKIIFWGEKVLCGWKKSNKIE